MQTKARPTMPTKPIGHDDDLSFVVWGFEPSWMEDARPWKMLAAFRFLQEALDYIAYCQDRGSNVVFQSPTGVRTVQASAQRVVAKGA